MMKKYILSALLLIFLFSGCKDIFTTSLFSDYKEDLSDMSLDELNAYLESTPLSDLSEEELSTAEDTLLDNRIELTDDLDNPQLIAEYLSQTTQLLAINMEQADIEGLLTGALSGEGDSSSVDDLVNDTERIDDLKSASEFAVDAFVVDPESLTSTELVVGSLGLISDILADEASSEKLDSVEDYNTDTLQDAGFTTEEIENIQLANAMMNLAREDMGDDMAGLLEGVPI
ncbi:MAG: hypothetical protein JXR64_07265 [Spirochaetales bacterium]|nr:hypothetical protein [Spirochaetales bacterium]